MRIAGSWPGDETDEEICTLLKSLQMTSERKNISQPADWWAAWEAEAKKANQHLSEWIADKCNAALTKRQQSKLSERRGRGQPKKNPGKCVD